VNAGLTFPLRAAAVAFSALAFCLAPSGEAFAQMLEPPQRPFRGLFGGGRPADPDRTSQELSLRTTVSTGFEDALAQDGAPGGVPGTPSADSFVGHGDALLRYWIGSSRRNAEIFGRGFVTAFPNLDVDPVVGGEGVATATTSVFRERLTFGGRYSASYQPLLSLGGFGALSGDIGSVDLPDHDEAFGLREQGSWNYEGSGDASYRVTSRQTISSSMTLNQRRYTRDDGFDTRTTVGAAAYRWGFSRVFAFDAAYRDFSTAFTQQVLARDQRDQSMSLGLTYTKRISRTRTLQIEGGGGPSYVTATQQGSADRFNYWAPAARAAASIDLWRSWGFSADYRRSLTVLESVSLDSYYAHAGTVRFGGYLTSRFDVNLTAGLARGRANGTVEGETGRYENYTGVLQARYALTRTLATVVTYNYYQYHLSGVTVDPLIPLSAERNMIRVGLSLWLPLYGRYGAAPPAPTGGR
jgi:hypothetical protein